MIINAGVPILRPITLNDRSPRHPKWLHDLLYSPASATGSLSSEVLAPSLKRISKDAKTPYHLKRAVCSKLVVGAMGKGTFPVTPDLRQLGTEITLSLLQISGILTRVCLSSPGVSPEVRSWLFGYV